MIDERFTPDITELIGCLTREILRRQRIYPQAVSTGKITKKQARDEIYLMELAEASLIKYRAILEGKKQ